MDTSRLEKIMKGSGDHCSESIVDIHNANSVGRLADILFYYMKQCVQKDFPSIEIMRDYKDSGYPFGVFVEKSGVYEALKNNALFNSNITLKIDNYNISRIWLRGSSTLALEAKDNSIVFVDCFDSSQINIVAKDQSKVKVNLYGKSQCINMEGNAHINRTNKRVYEDNI